MAKYLREIYLVLLLPLLLLLLAAVLSLEFFFLRSTLPCISHCVRVRFLSLLCVCLVAYNAARRLFCANLRIRNDEIKLLLYAVPNREFPPMYAGSNLWKYCVRVMEGYNVCEENVCRLCVSVCVCCVRKCLKTTTLRWYGYGYNIVDDLHNTLSVNGGLIPSPSALNPTHE